MFGWLFGFGFDFVSLYVFLSRTCRPSAADSNQKIINKQADIYNRRTQGQMEKKKKKKRWEHLQ